MNKNTSRRIFFGLLLASVFLNSAISSEPKEILALELDLRFTKQGADQYNLLMNRLAENGLEYELSFLPLQRIWRTLSEQEDSCVFPSSIPSVVFNVEGLGQADLIESVLIDHVSYRAIVRPGEDLITQVDQLVGRKVAAWNGMPNEVLSNNADIDFQTTNTEETRVKMLYGERVDAMYGFIPDVHLVVDKLGLQQPETAGVLKIWGNRYGTHLVCHDTPENRLFVQQFDQALESVKKTDGGLREILGPFADL